MWMIVEETITYTVKNILILNNSAYCGMIAVPQCNDYLMPKVSLQ